MNLHEPSAAVAFTLGLWTAIQPCPITANLAAVAWLGRRGRSPTGGILAALLFVGGQMITYVTLAWLVLQGIAVSWRLSSFLQRHTNELLGPVWIVAAMVFLGLIHFRLPRLRFGQHGPTLPSAKWQGERLSPLPPGEGQGVRAATAMCPHPNPLRAPCAAWSGEGTIAPWSAFPLGIMLALAFCPVTAVLFFVNLLTITAAGGSPVVYPVLYSLGAALPVALFALLLQAGSRWFGRLLHRTQQMQQWLNLAAGVGLLVIGIYFCLRFNFALLPW